MGLSFGGLDWYRGDFHVHTPFSRCYQESGVSAQDLLGAANGLDFMVVADHNTFEGYLHLLEFREGKGPVLFPGVELKVPAGYGGIRMLVLLDPDQSPEELMLFLWEIGVKPEARGDEGFVLTSSLNSIARVVAKFDGIVLWTEPGSPEGIMAGVDLNQRGYIQGLDWPASLLDLGGGDPGWEQAGIWGSNAQRPQEIGRASTLIKMERLDFASLKFALQDPKARVAQGTGSKAPRYPRILSLRVSGGFLADQEFLFNPGLNCLIGARGTGKTTLLKLLSFALGMPAGEGINQLLGSGEVQVDILDEAGEHYSLRRRAHEPGKAFDSLGRPVKSDSGAHSLFFGQGEIERVMLEPGFQLRLLDSLWDSAQLIREHNSLGQALAENGARLEELDDCLVELQEQLEGKEVLLQRLAELQSYPLAEIQARLTSRDRELQTLAAMQEVVRQHKRVLRQLPYGRDKGWEILAEPLKRTAAAADRLVTLWEEAEKDLAGYAQAAEERHRQLEEEYRSLLGGCADSRVRELVRERQRIQSELVRLEPLADRLAQLECELNGLERSRRQLLQNWTSLGEGIFNARLAAAQRINAVLSPGVRLDIVKAGLSLPYRDFLGRWLGDLGLGTVRALAEKVQPAQLRELTACGDTAGLIRLSGLAPERCRRITVLLGGRKALQHLETLPVTDLVRICLQVGTEEKAGPQLSTGQRCTALLPVLLLAAKGPLVIDQPEDNLDNAYVCSTLVTRLREMKHGRQFIFATHNPNIPVLADAEQNFILESDGRRGWVRAQGAIENTRVKDLIQEIMEGGKDAFKRRARRYGQLAP